MKSSCFLGDGELLYHCLVSTLESLTESLSTMPKIIAVFFNRLNGKVINLTIDWEIYLLDTIVPQSLKIQQMFNTRLFLVDFECRTVYFLN